MKINAAVLMMAGTVSASGWGVCPETVPVVEKLDVERYMGDWYEWYQDSTYWQELFDCGVKKYEITDKKTLVVHEDYKSIRWYWPWESSILALDLKFVTTGKG